MSNSFSQEGEISQPPLENSCQFQQPATLSSRYQPARFAAKQLPQPDHLHQSYSYNTQSHHGHYYPSIPPSCYTHQVPQTSNTHEVLYQIPGASGQAFNQYSRWGPPESIAIKPPPLRPLSSSSDYSINSGMASSGLLFTRQPPSHTLGTHLQCPPLPPLRPLYPGQNSSQNNAMIPGVPQHMTKTITNASQVLSKQMELHSSVTTRASLSVHVRNSVPKIANNKEVLIPQPSYSAPILRPVMSDEGLLVVIPQPSYSVPILRPVMSDEGLPVLQTQEQCSTPSTKRRRIDINQNLESQDSREGLNLAHDESASQSSDTMSDDCFYYSPFSPSMFLVTSSGVVDHEPSTSMHPTAVVTASANLSGNGPNLFPHCSTTTISNVSPSSKASPRPTFSLVFETLFPICSEWHNFGLPLGLLESTLKRIKHNNSVCEDCLRETLAVRISDKPLTWRDVIRTLRSVTVSNNELAMTIEREHSDQLDVQILLDSQEQRFQNITSTVINIPDCVLRFASYLKDRYKRMPVLPDTWPPPLDEKDHFTNLALIERRKHCKLPQAKSKNSIEYDYAYGNVDNIVERKQAIKLENLFEPLAGEDSTQDQFIILMDGAPGVGKTTISRKICKMWSNDKYISHFQLVIFLPLRELLICSNISVVDLLPADDPKLKDQIVQHVQRTSGSGILFIFDGFDELSSYQRTKHSLFLDIVKGNKLHKCSVLVTSRTYASGPLEVISRIDRHVEVLGFTKQQINGCIRRNIPEKDKAKLLFQMLKERLDIISLCYIPLNCRIVLYVYQQQYTLPDTLTELYEVFILYTIKHYAEKISSDEEVEEQIKQANSLDSLPPVIIEQLHILLETAYTGMTEDKLVFECNQIRQPKISLNFGLLNKIDLFRNDRNKHYYQFLHFTLQEFLAAKYLSMQKKFTRKKFTRILVKIN